MHQTRSVTTILRAIAGAVLAFGVATTVATATEPCDDFGECKVLIEINARDGDIGFHFLMDGDDLSAARITDPNGVKVFQDRAGGPLRRQKLTETFVESAEPLCWADPEADPDDEIVTLEEFLARWTPGTYVFSGITDDGERSRGETELKYEIPAAPTDLEFDGSVISWSAGNDLGNCASAAELDALVADDVLPVHPEFVTVVAWEVVFEPDIDEGDPTAKLKYTVRVAGDIAVKAITVPGEYLMSLPDDTPMKFEVGAIGVEDNATFWEEDGFCVNEVKGCD